MTSLFNNSVTPDTNPSQRNLPLHGAVVYPRLLHLLRPVVTSASSKNGDILPVPVKITNRRLPQNFPRAPRPLSFQPNVQKTHSIAMSAVPHQPVASVFFNSANQLRCPVRILNPKSVTMRVTASSSNVTSHANVGHVIASSLSRPTSRSVVTSTPVTSHLLPSSYLGALAPRMRAPLPPVPSSVSIFQRSSPVSSPMQSIASLPNATQNLSSLSSIPNRSSFSVTPDSVVNSPALSSLQPTKAHFLCRICQFTASSWERIQRHIDQRHANQPPEPPPLLPCPKASLRGGQQCFQNGEKRMSVESASQLSTRTRPPVSSANTVTQTRHANTVNQPCSFPRTVQIGDHEEDTDDLVVTAATHSCKPSIAATNAIPCVIDDDCSSSSSCLSDVEGDPRSESILAWLQLHRSAFYAMDKCGSPHGSPVCSLAQRTKTGSPVFHTQLSPVMLDTTIFSDSESLPADKFVRSFANVATTNSGASSTFSASRAVSSSAKLENIPLSSYAQYSVKPVLHEVASLTGTADVVPRTNGLKTCKNTVVRTSTAAADEEDCDQPNDDTCDEDYEEEVTKQTDDLIFMCFEPSATVAVRRLSDEKSATERDSSLARVPSSTPPAPVDARAPDSLSVLQTPSLQKLSSSASKRKSGASYQRTQSLGSESASTYSHLLKPKLLPHSADSNVYKRTMRQADIPRCVSHSVQIPSILSPPVKTTRSSGRDTPRNMSPQVHLSPVAISQLSIDSEEPITKYHKFFGTPEDGVATSTTTLKHTQAVTQYALSVDGDLSEPCDKPTAPVPSPPPILSKLPYPLRGRTTIVSETDNSLAKRSSPDDHLDDYKPPPELAEWAQTCEPRDRILVDVVSGNMFVDGQPLKELTNPAVTLRLKKNQVTVNPEPDSPLSSQRPEQRSPSPPRRIERRRHSSRGRLKFTARKKRGRVSVDHGTDGQLPGPSGPFDHFPMINFQSTLPSHQQVESLFLSTLVTSTSSTPPQLVRSYQLTPNGSLINMDLPSE